MSLYADDVDVAIPLVLTTAQAPNVARIVLRYTPPGGTQVEWDLTPASSTASTVSFTRIAQAGDLPAVSLGGYVMRAKVYDEDDLLLFETDEFKGPRVLPRSV